MKKAICVIVSSFLLSNCSFPSDQTKTTIPASSPSPVVTTQVSLPSGVDAINLFWQLVNEKRIPEAIAMMSPSMVPDESTKQAYGVQFNDMKSARVLAIEANDKESWTTDRQIYKTTLEIVVDPRAASAPIPYYGYDSNPTTRFISVVKSQTGKWQINEIATGP